MVKRWFESSHNQNLISISIRKEDVSLHGIVHIPSIVIISTSQHILFVLNSKFDCRKQARKLEVAK